MLRKRKQTSGWQKWWRNDAPSTAVTKKIDNSYLVYRVDLRLQFNFVD